MSRKNRSNGHQTSRKRRNKEKKVYPTLEGTVQMTREGFGFVIVEGEEDDVFVKANKMGGALNGDRVLVTITRDKTEHSRREGVVKEIVQRSAKPFVGILHIIGGQAWVLMQSRVMPYDIQLNNIEEYPEAESGLKVSAVIDFWKRGDSCPTGHIVDILGQPGENDTEMHAILAEFGLPYRFDNAVENEADGISEKIGPAELEGREDFRDTLTFTIDPSDAKDFDDALSLKTLENGHYEVGVHIADVSWYVRPGMLMDDEAKSRGNSVYLVDRTVPMLPEKLSNKLCSLRPNEEKLTFSAVFELDDDAKVISRRFGRTVIRSDYRFAYETAQQVIDAGENAMKMQLCGGTDGKSQNIADPKIGSDAAMGAGITTGTVIPDNLKSAILTLHSLASKLRKKRFEAGAISFERPEMKVIVDEKGRPIDVCQKISKEANWLVEEFMLLANRGVAEFVTKSCKGKTFVYRVHDEPDPLKVANLREFVGNFGYKMGKADSGKAVSRELNSLFAAAKDKPEFNAIELLSLRTMAKARYDVENIGHYGLAFRYYTHFTSPIRRYPDMMVHRLLARYLAGGDSASKEKYESLCKKCSERETVAAEAERASIKYKLVEFMQDKLGYEFDGHISGLTEWGMYVEVEPTKIEGMIALRDIRTDYFEFDDKHYRLIGRRTHKVYNLGDAVRVKVKKANLEQKLLDYELIPLSEHAVDGSGNAGPEGKERAGKTAKSAKSATGKSNSVKPDKRANFDTVKSKSSKSKTVKTSKQSKSGKASKQSETDIESIGVEATAPRLKKTKSAKVAESKATRTPKRAKSAKTAEPKAIMTSKKVKSTKDSEPKAE